MKNASTSTSEKTVKGRVSKKRAVPAQRRQRRPASPPSEQLPVASTSGAQAPAPSNPQPDENMGEIFTFGEDYLDLNDFDLNLDSVNSWSYNFDEPMDIDDDAFAAEPSTSNVSEIRTFTGVHTSDGGIAHFYDGDYTAPNIVRQEQRGEGTPVVVGRPFAFRNATNIGTFHSNLNALMAAPLSAAQTRLANDLFIVHTKEKFHTFPRNANEGGAIKSKVLTLRSKYSAELLRRINKDYYFALRIFIEAFKRVVEEQLADQPPHYFVKIILGIDGDATLSRGQEWNVSCFRTQDGASFEFGRAIETFMNFLTSQESFELFDKITVVLNVYPPTEELRSTPQNTRKMRTAVGDNAQIDNIGCTPATSLSYRDGIYDIRRCKLEFVLAHNNIQNLQMVEDPKKLVQGDAALAQSCLPSAIVTMAFKRTLLHDRDLAMDLLWSWNGAAADDKTPVQAPKNCNFKTFQDEKPACDWGRIYWDAIAAIIAALTQFDMPNDTATSRAFSDATRSAKRSITDILRVTPESKELAQKFGLRQVVAGTKLPPKVAKSRKNINDHLVTIENAIDNAFTKAIKNFKNNGLIDLIKDVIAKCPPPECDGRYALGQTCEFITEICRMKENRIEKLETNIYELPQDEDRKFRFFYPIRFTADIKAIMGCDSRKYMFQAFVLSHGNGGPLQSYAVYNVHPNMKCNNTAAGVANVSLCDDENKREAIFIIQHENHVFGLSSFRSFMRTLEMRYELCPHCSIIYSDTKNDPTAHMCKDICKICYVAGCSSAGQSLEALAAKNDAVICSDCHRWLPPTCMENHKLFNYTDRETLDKETHKRVPVRVCDMVQQCVECGALVNKFRLGHNHVHQCGASRCTFCGAHHEKGVYCKFTAFNGMQRSKAVGANLPLYLDFETAFISTKKSTYEARELLPFHATVGMMLTKNEIAEHETLLGEKFISTAASTVTNHDGESMVYATVKTFDGVQCNRNMVKWILESRLCRNRAIVAHNGNRFDFTFIQNELMHQGITPEIITDGHDHMVRMKICIRTNTAVVKNKKSEEIHFVDSFKFCSFSLEKMCKNLVSTKETREKQFFPYGALTMEAALRGELDIFPEKKHFGLNVQGNPEFDAWHASESQNYINTPYPIVEIVKTYCNNDVRMLAEAFTAFLKWLRKVNIKLNPLSDVTTIAGMAQKTFLGQYYHYEREKVLDETLSKEDNQLEAQQLRTNWKDKPISIVGDVAGTNQSKEADKFLEFLNRHCNLKIQCKQYGGEHKVRVQGRPLSVDGFMELPNNVAEATIDKLIKKFDMVRTVAPLPSTASTRYPAGGTTKLIVVYQGCFYHGCGECMNPDRLNFTKNLRMGQVKLHSDERVRLLAQQGYEVLEAFPCRIQKTLKKTKLGKLYDDIKLQRPYRHRDGLFGGRCENISRYYESCVCTECSCSGCLNPSPTNKTSCTTCEHKKLALAYLDITSLYPWVLATKPYPVGDPINIIQPDPADLDDWFGFAQCVVIPPRDLFIPVLPVRDAKGRLVFGLCNECINKQTKENCTHPDELRAITGVFFTEELKKAVEYGYKIDTVHQVYHWPTNSSDIFKEYIQHFFEIKMLCDGLTDELKKLAPEEQNNDATAQEEKIKMRVRDIARDLCGLDLKLDQNFEENKALRFVVKLMLNSLWGRFGLHSDGKKTEFFSEDQAEKVFKLLRDVNRDILHYVVLDGPNDTGTVSITHKPKEGSVGDEAKVSVPLAAMTTGWARLRMYEIMSAVRDQTDIIYYDTDSIVAVESALPDLQKYMEHSFMLGQLKSELTAGEKIVKFLCCGPKSYMYVTNKGNVTQHFKGISLCNEVEDALSEEFVEPIVKKHACGGPREPIKVNQFQIVKTCTAPGNLHAREIEKTVQSTVDMKRKWTDFNSLTYPYGYDIEQH